MRDRWAKLGSGGKIGVVVAALLVIGACGSGTDTRTVHASFGPTTVWDEIEQEAPSGAFTRVQVYFKTEGSALSAAENCLDYYLQSYEAATCYGFDSYEAYEAAQVTPSGMMVNLCWNARAVKATPELPWFSELGKPSNYDACP